jgi:hypothetical protein
MDKSVDNSVLEIAVLHLFTKHKSSNQHIKFKSILALCLVPLLSFPLLSLLFLLFLILLLLFTLKRIAKAVQTAHELESLSGEVYDQLVQAGVEDVKS